MLVMSIAVETGVQFLEECFVLFGGPGANKMGSKAADSIATKETYNGRSQPNLIKFCNLEWGQIPENGKFSCNPLGFPLLSTEFLGIST